MRSASSCLELKGHSGEGISTKDDFNACGHVRSLAGPPCGAGNCPESLRPDERKQLAIFRREIHAAVKDHNYAKDPSDSSGSG